MEGYNVLCQHTTKYFQYLRHPNRIIESHHRINRLNQKPVADVNRVLSNYHGLFHPIRAAPSIRPADGILQYRDQ